MPMGVIPSRFSGRRRTSLWREGTAGDGSPQTIHTEEDKIVEVLDGLNAINRYRVFVRRCFEMRKAGGGSGVAHAPRPDAGLRVMTSAIGRSQTRTLGAFPAYYADNLPLLTPYHHIQSPFGDEGDDETGVQRRVSILFISPCGDMRISIPSIPSSSSSRAQIDYTLSQATDLLADFLRNGKGKTMLMTGAGVSVDSGIAPYRGENGHYTIHKTYRPIFYPEFIDPSPKGHAFRQRYWSRSFLGFKPVQFAHPNPTHYSIAALQRMGYIPEFITQNVDNLHHAATPSPSLAAQSILELHGSLQNIVCVSSPTEGTLRERPIDPVIHARLSASHLVGPRKRASPVPHNTPTGEAYPNGCGFRGSRTAFQDLLEQTNPMWDEFAKEMRAKKTEPKTNPDGDVDLGNNVDYSTFKYPPCPNCGGVLKPAVIFFGESVPPLLRDRSYDLISNSSSLLLVGTSLATYSAFRLVKHAIELGKPVGILNIGPTRADSIVEAAGGWKVDGVGSSQVLKAVGEKLANERGAGDLVTQRLLSSGVIKQLEKRGRGVVSS